MQPKSMRDERRRNRNIGTAKAGRGSDNKHVIPERWADLSVYWQQLEPPVLVEREILGCSFTFIVEPTLNDCFHFCTIEDVCNVLEDFPRRHIEGISLIVFRQPTRRQQILAPVWGRLGYWSEIAGRSGLGIYLEAQRLPRTDKWPLSLSPDQEQELDRLRADGHDVARTKRSYEISSSADSIRATQLYRTLPHEVGHYVDYLEFSSSFDMDNELERFWELYDSKPKVEKESYAHRYADETRERLVSSGQCPFEPIVDVDAMKSHKLLPEWFNFGAIHAA